MSKFLPAIAQKIFDQELQHEYQGIGVVRKTVRTKNAKGAKTLQFQLTDQGLASERTTIQTPLVPMDIVHTPKIATMKDFTASEFTDIFKNNQIGTIDERRELFFTIASALGRKEDQEIIDTLDADVTITKTVPDDVSGSTDNLTVEAIKEAGKQLDDDNVPPGSQNRTILVTTSGFHHLLDDVRATSTDFVTNRALETGMIPGFYGFNIVMVNERLEGGLPNPSGNKRTLFAYHRRSYGHGINMDLKTTTDWIALNAAWFTTGFLSIGGVVIDPKGVVKITIDES